MWILAAVVLGLAAGPPSSAPDPVATAPVRDAALRAYAQGRLLEEGGELREALGQYIRALSLDRASVPVARHVAELVARMGDSKSALEYADQALAIDSTDARSLWVRGASLLSLGRTDEALAALTASARNDSTQLEPLQMLARTAAAADRVDLEAWAWQRALDIDPDDGDSWFHLATAQARLGRFAEADSSLKQANALSPMRVGQLFLQGWVAESLGRNDEAITMYRHHLEAHPDDQATLRRLVNVLARAGHWKEAWPEAKRIEQESPADFDALMVGTEIAMHAGEAAEAKTGLLRLAAAAEGDADRATVLTAMLVRVQRPDDAVSFADGWASRHAGTADAPLLSARVRAVLGRREEALPFARGAVDVAPDSLEPRLLLAQLCVETKHFGEADSTLLEATRRHPGDTGLLLELASMREERGDDRAAEAAARDALRIEPDNARALNFLGYLMADHDRRLPEAMELIRRALAAEPDNGAFVDSMGWVLFRLGRYDDARVQLERAVDLTGGDPTVREHLGDAYRKLRQPDRAHEQYRLAAERDSTNTRLRDKRDAPRP